MVKAVVEMVVGGGFGLLSITGLFGFYLPKTRTLRRGAEAPGTIVASRSEEVGSKTVYHPIIEFAMADEQLVKYQDRATADEDYQAGNEVTVHYNLEEPESSATIANRKSLVKAAMAYAFCAVFFAAMFIVGLLSVVR